MEGQAQAETINLSEKKVEEKVTEKGDCAGDKTECTENTPTTEKTETKETADTTECTEAAGTKRKQDDVEAEEGKEKKESCEESVKKVKTGEGEESVVNGSTETNGKSTEEKECVPVTKTVEDVQKKAEEEPVTASS